MNVSPDMSDDKPYKYDVFISYRWIEPDQSWVHDQLTPALENAGLEVLLDVEDFVPGTDVIGEMTRAGKESKRGLCVLSPDYVNDPDRMVNFERLMLRRKDPSGRGSRLIPFILRSTELPDDIFGLVAIDWTNPKHHAREWTKLLNVLGATNLNAPPPGPLVNDPNKPPTAPPPTPKPLPTSTPPLHKRIPKPVWLSVLSVLLLVAIFAVVYRACRKPNLITITGTVYFQQAPGDSRLLAVEGAEVSLSQDSKIRSERTGPDGKFVLEGVPANASKDLTFEYGGAPYPMAYQANGNYAAIPPSVDPARKFIDTSWIESKEDCLPFQDRSAPHFKVFMTDIEFQHESGKNTALLTVELVNAPELMVLSAYALATPNDSVSNQTPHKKDLQKSHTWKFDLSKSAQKPKLRVCLGSNRSSDEISSTELFTYYTLP